MQPRSLLTPLAFLIGVIPAWADAPPTWPQWRGPTRDSQVGGKPWPKSLQGKALEQLWRVELGEGYPGPVVAADRVFVAETRAGTDEVVRALDRKTGKELWTHSWKGSLSVPFFARANGSWIRSTPAYDGQTLYVGGIRDVVVALDGKTGKELWKADLAERHKSALPAFGFVSSPLVDGEHLYVQAAGAFLELDRRTGATLWRTLEDGGGMYGSAFSSPVIATLQGRRQAVVQTRTKLCGVNLDSGKELWAQPIPATRGMNILTPTVVGDAVFTGAYGAKTYRFDVGKVAPGKDDPKAEVKYAVAAGWTAPLEGYMSSPVVVGGHAYLHLRNQRLVCIDLKDGKVRWTSPRAFGKYWSMVAQGDRLLALDERGILLLLKANPDKFELLDERKISQQETWGHLAVCGDELFVRELKGVAAYRWSE